MSFYSFGSLILTVFFLSAVYQIKNGVGNFHLWPLGIHFFLFTIHKVLWQVVHM